MTNSRRGRFRPPKPLRRAVKRYKKNRHIQRTRVWRARLYRRLVLRKVRFVGITGSCGKTSTKEFTAAILSVRFRGKWSPGIKNLPELIAETILEVSPRDEFCVLELAAAAFGERIPYGRFLEMVQPDVGVVTNIGTDHLSAFGSVEAIAEAKAGLIDSLPASGTAILNADDPLVKAMGPRCRGRVMTFGLDPEATLRAENVRSAWPDRLSFTLVHGTSRFAVETQLCGAFWVYPVLAAIAVGLELGVPLADSVHAVKGVPPYDNRMEPVVRPDGVTFVRDDHKAPIGSIPLSLDFMREARAARKIVIIGSISDYRGNSSRTFVSVARQALEVADFVAFVGPRASKCLKAQKNVAKGRLLAFLTPEAAARHLGEVLQPGDLVLLKGGTLDGLGRILEGGASGAEGGVHEPVGRNSSPTLVVIGIGNPGLQHSDNPHNLGHRVVDMLARSLGLSWRDSGGALVASQARGGATLVLVKPMTKVNNSGKEVQHLSEVMGFRREDCIVVLDDVDLPVGSVRLRQRGSDGGHLGLRSILGAFGSEELRRLKIGVDQPRRGASMAEHVLAPVAEQERAQVERGCERAMEVLNEVVREMLGPTEGIEPPTSLR
jgi:UDP-N-acetylmuramoyl-tripeptide--D-alanyl-D-alanine ligase